MEQIEDMTYRSSCIAITPRNSFNFDEVFQDVGDGPHEYTTGAVLASDRKDSPTLPQHSPSIESIIDSQINERSGKLEYKLLWTGGERTWDDAEDLMNCDKLLAEFHSKRSSAKSWKWALLKLWPNVQRLDEKAFSEWLRRREEAEST